jgi:hypothetical protein
MSGKYNIFEPNCVKLRVFAYIADIKRHTQAAGAARRAVERRSVNCFSTKFNDGAERKLIHAARVGLARPRPP